MIEDTVIEYLNNNAVVACAEKPISPPVKYVVVEKTGSNDEDILKRATLAIQSHADSLYNAAELNEHIKLLMNDMPAHIDSVSEVSTNSDYNFTDTSKKQYRYQAIFNITYFD